MYQLSFLKNFDYYETLFEYSYGSYTLDIDKQKYIDYLYEIREKVKYGNKRSNSGGYQTLDNLDTLDIFKDLTDKILESFTNRSKVKAEFINMWGNINPPHTANEVHNHAENYGNFQNVLSGVLYLKVPEGDSGSISFNHPQNISMVVKKKPEENEVLFFPCYFEHSVDINNTKEDRISIAFNLKLDVSVVL